MSRLGNLNGKALRVALCAVEVAGAAAEPIGGVQAIVDSRYDEVAYGGYTRAMVRDELGEEPRGAEIRSASKEAGMPRFELLSSGELVDNVPAHSRAATVLLMVCAFFCVCVFSRIRQSAR